MLPRTKKRVIKSAFWATLITGVGCALAFLTSSLPIVRDSAKSWLLAVGYGLLSPGAIVFLFVGNLHDMGPSTYLLPLVSWIIYFGVFYGTFGAYGSTKVPPPR